VVSAIIVLDKQNDRDELPILFSKVQSQIGSRDSTVDVATRLRAGRVGSGSRQGWEFFSSPPRLERLWGLHSLLSNGYRK